MNRRSFLSVMAALAGIVSSIRLAVAGRKKGAASNKANNKYGDRREPMFRDEADARDIIREYCTGDVNYPLNAAQTQMLVSKLEPQLWLAFRKKGGGGLGETRLGGAPDMPKGTAWPLRPVPTDAAAKAAEWSKHHKWITRQLVHEVPFEFIGQIDLAEGARFPEHARDLPPSGRLLFFWDGATGLLEPGAASCRVIYDDGPTTALERLPIPVKFAEMEAWWREPDPAQVAHFKKTAQMLEAEGQKESAEAMRRAASEAETPDASLKKPFVYPARAMQLQPLFVLPSRQTLDVALDSKLKAFAEGDETEEHYELLTSSDSGPHSSDRSGLRTTQSWSTMQSRLNRVMGSPTPEQDDPRYDVLDPAQLPPYPWNDKQIAQASRAAAEWQLLLQVSIADLTQEQTEGTVYFMITKADLAKRDFSRVAATYQQT